MENAITSAVELAAYIKTYYRENFKRDSISPIKLQKALYFCFAYWGSWIRKGKESAESIEIDISQYSEYLFNDRIEAWVYGPVVPAVYQAEKRGEINEINSEEYLKNNIFVKDYINELLDSVLRAGDFTLVEISHQDKAWIKNFDENSPIHNKEINKEEIIREYV